MYLESGNKDYSSFDGFELEGEASNEEADDVYGQQGGDSNSPKIPGETHSVSNETKSVTNLARSL